MFSEKLADEIFDKLGHKILNMILNVEKKQKATKDNKKLCNILNNKVWLQSTSKSLHSIKKPLVQLCLNKDNSVCGSASTCRNGKLLDRFIEAVTSPHRIFEQIPPFKITADSEFFRHENYQSLLNCFQLCGKSLVDLEIYFPSNGGSMMFIFPPLTLPVLPKCSVCFVERDINIPDHEVACGKGNGTYLLQALFSICKNLRCLKVTTYWQDSFTYSFERLVLPKTLLQLQLISWIKGSTYWNVLISNRLPNLKGLTLVTPNHVENPICNQLVTKILVNFQRSLVNFCAGSIYTHSPFRAITYFQMPEMRNLEEFNSDTTYLELKEVEVDLEKKLPRLRRLCLENQSKEMLKKWIDHSRFAAVKELIVSLVDDNLKDDLEDAYISLKAEVMQHIMKTFPNLQILEMTVCGEEFCGLKFVFQHFKRLSVLKLVVRNFGEIDSSDSWDALLIGTSLEMASALSVACEDGNPGNFKDDSVPSIRDLLELEELSLITEDPLSDSFHLEDSLISDASFQFAFCCLPKLLKLKLEGRFKPTPKAVAMWESYGREIIYDLDESDDSS